MPKNEEKEGKGMNTMVKVLISFLRKTWFLMLQALEYTPPSILHTEVIEQFKVAFL